MKKQFKLTAINKAPERQVDSVKFEIKKYLKRERKKDLPENADYWDFDCLIGLDETKKQEIKVVDINSNIDELVKEDAEGFYIELMAKPGFRTNKRD